MTVIPEETRNELLDSIRNNNPSSFLAGRDFRAWHEFNIPNGETLTVKIEVPIDIYVTNVVVNVSEGALRYASYFGGTEGGTFNEITTVVNKNKRSDAGQYTRQVKAYIGGTVTGGFQTDVAQVRTGTNNQRVSIIESTQSKRGIAAGDYYLTFENTGNNVATGVIYTFWTE